MHVLVIPKGKYVSFADFSAGASADEIAGFMRAVGKVAKDLGLEAQGYRLLANMGEHSGQEVPHFHVHLFAGRPLGRMLSSATAADHAVTLWPQDGLSAAKPATECLTG